MDKYLFTDVYTTYMVNYESMIAMFSSLTEETFSASLKTNWKKIPTSY